MCGIFSVFHVQPPTCLDKMWNAIKVLSRRGPDCSTVVMNKREFLAFQRLAIVDTSVAGNQPFFSDDRQVAVMCNGEIYNYKELIQKYDLHCTSCSDCEVLLRLYEKIGFQAMAQQLDGVFAIVLRDYRINKVFIARDYIGVRPLFQGTTVDGSPAFASVAAALLPFCRNVQQVPAKKVGELNLDNLPLGVQFMDNFPPLTLSLEHASLRTLLFEAVKKRLQGDRPVGCLLSGGLDSSVVAFLLKKLHGNVRTYSIGMHDPLADVSSNNRSVDCRYAEDVASHLGTAHTEVNFTPLEGFEVIPEVIQALESYDITTVRASVPMYLLAKYIKTHTEDTIIFSGEGSDELFAGYLYFKKAPSVSALLMESNRLIRELPYFDVLRADRCISSNGLEVRVPFLDVNVVEFAHRMGAGKWPHNDIEKFHLRTCFEGDLPEHVLWRRKDGLSDGVSGSKTWATYIQEFVDNIISDETFESCNGMYPSKEALYYYEVYKRFFPSLTSNMPHYWMPKWTNQTDPSGRLVEACQDWTPTQQ